MLKLFTNVQLHGNLPIREFELKT